VGALQDAQRNAVEGVFERHYSELGQNRNAEAGLADSTVIAWAAEALRAPRFSLHYPAEAALVAAAVVKINRGNCPNYKEEN
jgi:hypothetical protein